MTVPIQKPPDQDDRDAGKGEMGEWLKPAVC